ARAVSMTPNVSTVVARNTSSASIMLELSPNTSSSRSVIAGMAGSDPEIHHAKHDQIADSHPAAGEHQGLLGDVLMPDAGVEIGRDKLDDEEHRDRQRR